MTENKKIKNAKVTTYNGITFRSLLELNFYKTLESSGLKPDYEMITFILQDGFYPTVPFYNRVKRTKELTLDKTKVREITYTPDFTIMKDGVLFIIEAKGIENDVFPVKKKLFRKFLENIDAECVFFEVRTKKELLQVIDIIKSYGNSTKNKKPFEATSCQ